MAEVISVLSRKGGVGKTVTAMYTAALLQQRGRDVAVLDKDPEGSAGVWTRAAGDCPFRSTRRARARRPCGTPGW